MSYAAVFPLLRTRAFTAPFDYEIPRRLQDAVDPGALVAAPLGAQTVIGVVLAVRPETTHPGRIVPIRDLLDVPAIPPDLLELAGRVERYYLTSFSAALALVCPPIAALRVVRQYELTPEGGAAREAGEEDLDLVAGLKLPAGAQARLAERYRRKGWVRIGYRVHVAGAAPAARRFRRGGQTPPRLGPRQRAALDIVAAAGTLDERELKAACGIATPALRRLLEAGALVETEQDGGSPGVSSEGGEAAPRAVGSAAPAPSAATENPPPLLPEQREALRVILEVARAGDEVLVHGVTGSGKTEVYLQAARAALERGRSVLVLVPEIGLTGQTVSRIRRRFVGERIVVLHSRLSAKERLLAHRAVASGEARIVVGARSAVFAPLRDLGLIVVDEEHDVSYKQESEPCYDARMVARWRASRSGAVVVLGSATPSVESVARVRLHADLRLRVDGTPPPSLEIVDMRDHHGVFSSVLSEALAATVDAGEKAIVFLNRRGFASYLVCDHCGHAWLCPHCDVALTLYRSRGLLCRTCGHSEEAPGSCPSCGGVDLVRHGFGTERVEREVRDLLPGVELLRLDSDVAASYGRLRSVLGAFAAPGPKVLVGTQMIAKGHHFPEVTLVGVVNADLTLHFPDFRAEERTFAMVLQVGGRSGRGDRPGRVVVQTLNPEARPIAYAARGEEERFYAEEVERRTLLGYPPATSLIALEISGEDAPQLELAGAYTAEQLRRLLPAGAEVLGPGPQYRERRRHACRVVVKTAETGETLDALRGWLAGARDRYAARGVRLVPDVDPQWL